MSEAKDLGIAVPNWLYFLEEFYKYLGVVLSYFSYLLRLSLDTRGGATGLYEIKITIEMVLYFTNLTPVAESRLGLI